MTSSGSAVSAKAVKPRRSRKTTVTSRRCVWRGSSAPPSTISSASWGEKKRFRRQSRSSWATWASTRCSSVRFHSASLARPVASTESWSSLIRSIDFTLATSAIWSTGLVRYSSPPASRPATTSFGSALAVTMMIGVNGKEGSARSCRQTSSPSTLGIMTSRRIRSGRGSRAAASAASPSVAVRTS